LASGKEPQITLDNEESMQVTDYVYLKGLLTKGGHNIRHTKRMIGLTSTII